VKQENYNDYFKTSFTTPLGSTCVQQDMISDGLYKEGVKNSSLLIGLDSPVHRPVLNALCLHNLF